MALSMQNFAPAESSASFPKPLLFLMSSSCGITVASLYYNQPLLEDIRRAFDAAQSAIGWVPTLTQAGYAAGMLLLVPLGDMLERKRLILFFNLITALCLFAIGFAPVFAVVVAASFLLGLLNMTPQLLIPFAAHLAPPKEKGHVIGTMVSGLLLGILLARTVSGFVGAAWGWRSMFVLAACVLVALSAAFMLWLPKSNPSYQGSYVGLFKSVIDIFRTQPVLQESAFFGAMLFAAFSAFWANLIHLMESPVFNMGSRAVGLFGLLGAAAAALSPFFGRLADRKDPRTTAGIMMSVTLFSFLIFLFFGYGLVGLAIGVLLMDVGVQCGHVCNQSRIFALIPSAQSRIQTAYMFCYFCGGAVGSLLGSWAWSQYQWTGVCLTSLGLLSLALARYAWGSRQ